MVDADVVADDRALFAAVFEPLASDPVAAELTAAFGPRAPFAVEGPKAGRWSIRYVGEYTSWNTERDALQSAADTAETLGYVALLWRDERGPFVQLTRGRWFEAEKAHDPECECRDCALEEYDPAELLAGQSDRRAA